MGDTGRVQADLHDPPLDLVGAGQRRAGRQLQHSDQVAAIDLGNEANRRVAELVEAVAEDRNVEDEHDRHDPHRATDQPVIAAGETIETPVEGPKKSANRPRPPRRPGLPLLRFEQKRAHRRRQRQRYDQRDDRRTGNRERELPVELAGDAGDEDRWHEDSAQHQRDRDQRLPHLVHALVGCGTRIEPCLDVALDVLHHDDRVVDHDADREHQAEQRKIVEREAEHRHEEECADQRHRNGNDRNDRGTPRLQE